LIASAKKVAEAINFLKNSSRETPAITKISPVDAASEKHHFPSKALTFHRFLRFSGD
jgi:hypothetical protein